METTLESLTENEFEIINALYNRERAISSRNIQGEIALRHLRAAGKESKKIETIERNINTARNIGANVPGYTTINKLLSALKNTAFVAEREVGKGERAKYVYFIKPAAREYIGKYMEKNKIFGD